jgi:hypothetical protein
MKGGGGIGALTSSALTPQRNPHTNAKYTPVVDGIAQT